MISGKRLYNQKNLKGGIQANKKGEVNLKSINDPTLKAICNSMLKTDPKERIDSATSVYLRIDLFNKKIPVPEENAALAA